MRRCKIWSSLKWKYENETQVLKEIPGEKMQNLVISAMTNLLQKHSLTTFPIQNKSGFIGLFYGLFEQKHVLQQKSQRLWRATM